MEPTHSRHPQRWFLEAGPDPAQPETPREVGREQPQATGASPSLSKWGSKEGCGIAVLQPTGQHQWPLTQWGRGSPGNFHPQGKSWQSPLPGRQVQSCPSPPGRTWRDTALHAQVRAERLLPPLASRGRCLEARGPRTPPPPQPLAGQVCRLAHLILQTSLAKYYRWCA